MGLSKNFTWSEFTKSDVAAKNHIMNEITDWDVRDNILALVENLLQPLRDAWGKPIVINSGYRCPELNKKVGGVETSQHVFGEAADCGVDDPLGLARLVLELGLPFDQMVLYSTFLHLSYTDNRKNRMQVLYNKSYKGERI